MSELTDFIPKRRLVSNVTREAQAIVTTVQDHGYFNGYIVRLFVPSEYGMNVYDEGEISVIDSNNFFISINTSDQLPFSTPVFPPINFTQAQVIPISGITTNQAV